MAPPAVRQRLTAVALGFHMGDVMIQEPSPMQRYDRLVPQIDSALAAARR